MAGELVEVRLRGISVVEDYPVREPGNARILYAAFLSQTISFVMYLELRND